MTKRIHFLIAPPGAPKSACYQHTLIAIAEGLSALDIHYTSNRKYWRRSCNLDDWLFTGNSNIDDADILITSSTYLRSLAFPYRLTNVCNNLKLVLFDDSDGVLSEFEGRYKEFDLVLKTHYSSLRSYPSNVYPWAFGLTNRIIDALGNALNWTERKAELLVNFSCMHPVRRKVLNRALPFYEELFTVSASRDALSEQSEYDQLMWEQTGRRHYRSYFERLQSIQSVLAHGGLYPPIWELSTGRFARLLGRATTGYKDRILCQWDSWRFWESLAAGCLTMHLDLDKYGAVLPVQPENWVHYLGTDWDTCEKDINKLKMNPALAQEIAETGRDYAIKHYAPVPVANRLLQYIAEL